VDPRPPRRLPRGVSARARSRPLALQLRVSYCSRSAKGILILDLLRVTGWLVGRQLPRRLPRGVSDRVRSHPQGRQHRVSYCSRSAKEILTFDPLRVAEWLMDMPQPRQLSRGVSVLGRSCQQAQRFWVSCNSWPTMVCGLTSSVWAPSYLQDYRVILRLTMKSHTLTCLTLQGGSWFDIYPGNFCTAHVLWHVPARGCEDIGFRSILIL